MTTNVYDAISKKVASDSRWSIEGGTFLIYVDDTSFEKIEVVKEYVMMFAGMGPLIDQWKGFLRDALAGKRPLSSRPPLEGVCILCVDTQQNEILYAYGQDIVNQTDDGVIESTFTGSGGRHAAKCWKINRSATTAVETAKQLDMCSGGTVKSYEFDTRSNNLAQCDGLASALKGLSERGMVMYMPHDEHSTVWQKPVQEAANQDPRVKELLERVAEGRATLSAPCDGMLNKPTPEDESPRVF